MSLTTSYELLKPIADASGDRSIESRQLSSGRPVTIHLLAGGASAENRELLREIEALPPKYRVCFLETGNHEQYTYVVTDALSCTPSFRKWFASLQATIRGPLASHEADNMRVRAWQIPDTVNPVGFVAQGAPPRQSVPSPPSTPSSSGEFTRMFQVPQLPKETPAAQPKPAEPGQLSHALTAGEFTRMLQAPSAPIEATSSVSQGPLNSAEPASIEDEFTLLFGSQAPQPAALHPPNTAPEPPKTVPPSIEAPAASRAEFTQMFVTQTVAPIAAQPPIASPVPAGPIHLPITRPAASPGEFTQMFAAQTPPPAETQPLIARPAAANPMLSPSAPPAASLGEFTQMFATQTPPLAEAHPLIASPAPAKPIPSPSGPPAASPGEFTQMLAAQPPPHVASQPPILSAEPTKPAAPSLGPPAAGPGEFTQMFASQKGQPAVPQPPIGVPSSGDSKHLFQDTTALPLRVATQPNVSRTNADATLLFELPKRSNQPEAPADTPAQPHVQSAPGEFTRMFAAPSVPGHQPASNLPPRDPQHSAGMFDSNPAGPADLFPNVKPPRTTSQPGEFTRMMESPLARAGLKPQPFSASAPPIEKSREESGFTRMMESSPASNPQPPVAPPVRFAQPSGDATRAFQVAQAGQTPAAPEAQGPSEFTNMFKAPAKEPVRAEPKPAAKAPRVVPRRKKQTAYLKWILIGSVALLLIAVICFIVLR